MVWRFIFPISAYHRLRETLNSYLGAFRHAGARRLARKVCAFTPELGFLFQLNGFVVSPRWRPTFRLASMRSQYKFFRARFAGLILFQVGMFWEAYGRDAKWAQRFCGFKIIKNRPGLWCRCGAPLATWWKRLTQLRPQAVLLVGQTGKEYYRLQERTGCLLRIYFADVPKGCL